MSKHIVAAVLALFASGTVGAALKSEGGPRYLVDFGKSENLKVLFDAGLRPWRTLGLESAECEIGREQLTIRLPGGDEFEMDIERASFDIVEGNAIVSARFFGIDEPVPRAVDRVKRICTAMGLSAEGLDDLASNLGTEIDPTKRWHRSGRRNGVRVWVTFYPMFYRRGVEVQTWVGMQWPRRPGEYHFLKESIQPPPGYEHVLMDPPTPWRDRERLAEKPATPDAVPPQALSDGPRQRERTRKFEAAPVSPTVEATSGPLRQEPRSWGRWLWAAAVAAVVVIVIVVSRWVARTNGGAARR